MASELTMNRVIHAAVRRDLARTERALRGLRDGDIARARQVQVAWLNLVAELTDHHESEDALIWPYLSAEGVDGTLLESMEQEHREMASALAEATRVVQLAAAQADAARASAAADAVAKARAVTEAHLQHEEDAVEPLVLARADSPGWKAVAKKLRAGSPVRSGRMFAWLQDGAGAEEVDYLRATIPPPVLFVLTRLLGRGYLRRVAPAWR